MSELASDDPLYLQGRAHGWESGFESGREGVQALIDKAKILVEKLDRAETHEGGLLTVDMLNAKNELRLELSRRAK